MCGCDEFANGTKSNYSDLTAFLLDTVRTLIMLSLKIWTATLLQMRVCCGFD
jgi:hypothetical protein